MLAQGLAGQGATPSTRQAPLAWIQSNLYLELADAPFSKEDPTLNPTAGACVTCPRRSGYNTSLFADVQGDQCLDGACYETKVNAHIDRELAARPELVQIENGYRSPKEKRPGAVQRGHFREIEQTDNPDAEPVTPCEAAKPRHHRLRQACRDHPHRLHRQQLPCS